MRSGGVAWSGERLRGGVDGAYFLFSLILRMKKKEKQYTLLIPERSASVDGVIANHLLIFSIICYLYPLFVNEAAPNV